MPNPSIVPTDASTWPASCPTCGIGLWLTRQCMGHVDDEETGEVRHCGKHAMKGQTMCRSHGGAAPQARAAAQRRIEHAEAERVTATYGLPVDVDPHTALLEELHRSAGHVAWLGALIAALEHQEAVEASVMGPARDEDPDEGRVSRSGLKQYSREKGVTWEKPAVWVELYQWERTHLGNIAKACVQAGIEERRVRVAEQQGQLLAQVISAILTDLGHDLSAGPVREAVTRHLQLVQGPAA